MPSASMRRCNHTGCPELVHGTRQNRGRCPKHAKEDAQAYKRHYIAPTGANLYKTRQWKAFRGAFLERHPFCGDRPVGAPETTHSECRARGIVTVARTVDHIVPHRGDEALFYQQGNHQSLCNSCHSLKTAGEVGFGGTSRR